MAFHTELPIYKVAYDLLSVAVDYVRNMPRAIKAALGNRVTELAVEIVLLIAKANSARDAWLPYSQIEDGLETLEMGNHVELLVPEWLAKEKGLI